VSAQQARSQSQAVSTSVLSEQQPEADESAANKAHHVNTRGNYPGGIVYEEVMETEEFASVMDSAGFEG